MAALGDAVQLWNEWEIHLLVLLSFVLQVFLFCTGSLRQRSTNKFLRLCMWAAYLGADGVAVYTLGFLSRQDVPIRGNASGGIPPLAMIWVPFLLVHLGGPDNITAFAIEDNNLWVRHFLSLGLQVMLASYVIWKSSGWRDTHLLVPCIFVFVAGIIKYGERTMALKYGNLKSLSGIRFLEQYEDDDDGDFGVVLGVLRVMPRIHHLFAGRTVKNTFTEVPNIEGYEEELEGYEVESLDPSAIKRLEIMFGMVYDDLYTKATVLRTRVGVVFRCTAVICTIVALVLFLARNKQRYDRADVVITYLLFLGGICMEIWALFMILLSPWIWYWLNLHEMRFGWLASVSTRLLSRRLSKRRIFWSNSMGQYDLASAVVYDNARPTSWKVGLMRMIIGMVRLVGVGKEIFFWFSKLLVGIRYIEVDKEIFECCSKEAQHLVLLYIFKSKQDCFPNLGPLLGVIEETIATDISAAILLLHMFTEFHLSKYPPVSATLDMDDSPVGAVNEREKVKRLAEVCRKLSRYMLYVVMTYQEMFSTGEAMEQNLESVMCHIYMFGKNGDSWNGLKGLPEPQVCVETLEEIQRMWIRIILYAAGKSRPEMHAAQLARGGELLTFVWLLILGHNLGDSTTYRIGLFPPRRDDMDSVLYTFKPQVSPA